MDLLIITVILSTLVFLITFFIRALFRLITRKRWVGSDVYIHLRLIDLIRRNKHKPPERDPQILTSGFLGYPILFHWLLSFCSKSTIEEVEPFIGALIDSIHNLFLFFVALFLFKGRLPINDPVYVAFIASMIFATTPMLVKPDARTFSLSPRPFGAVFVSLTFMSLLNFHWSGDINFFIEAVITASFIFLSSKFAIQAFVIFLLFFVVFLNFPLLLLVIPASLIFAITLSLGHYLMVLKGHINHSIFYAKDIQYRIEELQTSPSITRILHNILTLKEKPIDILKKMYRNPTLKMVMYTPSLLLWFLSLYEGIAYTNTTLWAFSIWILAPILACLIFSFRHLRFLGEPDRYMEYSIFPLSILSAYYIIQRPSHLFMGIVVMTINLITVTINYWIGSTQLIIKPELEENLFNYLRSKSKSTNILPIPHQLGPKILYFTTHNILCFSVNGVTTHKARDEFVFLFPKTYPMVNTELEPIIETYKIETIVVDKRIIGKNGYNFLKFHKTFENDLYIVYELYHN